MTAYYNEIDPKAAAWLRELIKNNLIADGEVDERDIQDVRPTDLHGFAQCHFFAGIGVWSYALRRAGWPDDRPVWTGSCPCQPFSSAGKGGGFDDERHLWPSWHWLIAQCRPSVVFGEQVASKDAEPWLDLVQADMEALAYAVGAVPFPSAGIGAPHIRDRLYWVADAVRDGAEYGPPEGLGTKAEADGGDRGIQGQRLRSGVEGSSGWLADTFDERRRLGQPRCQDATDAAVSIETGRLAIPNGGDASAEWQQRGREQRQQPQDGRTGDLGDTSCRGQRELGHAPLAREGRYLDGSSDASGGLANAQHDDRRANVEERRPEGRTIDGGSGEPSGLADRGRDGRGASRHGDHGWDVGSQLKADGRNDWAGPTNGLWRDADWLFCRDGKWRPVEPGSFPLAYGAPARVGRLRGYGNAINAEAAIAWIEAYEAGRSVDRSSDTVRMPPR